MSLSFDMGTITVNEAEDDDYTFNMVITKVCNKTLKLLQKNITANLKVLISSCIIHMVLCTVSFITCKILFIQL